MRPATESDVKVSVYGTGESRLAEHRLWSSVLIHLTLASSVSFAALGVVIGTLLTDRPLAVIVSALALLVYGNVETGRALARFTIRNRMSKRCGICHSPPLVILSLYPRNEDETIDTTRNAIGTHACDRHVVEATRRLVKVFNAGPPWLAQRVTEAMDDELRGD